MFKLILFTVSVTEARITQHPQSQLLPIRLLRLSIKNGALIVSNQHNLIQAITTNFDKLWQLTTGQKIKKVEMTCKAILRMQHLFTVMWCLCDKYFSYLPGIREICLQLYLKCSKTYCHTNSIVLMMQWHITLTSHAAQ